MYSLLVLGLIPGTNISISFQVWIALGIMLILARPAYLIYQRYQLFMVRLAMRRPLHANQLHQRLHQLAR